MQLHEVDKHLALQAPTGADYFTSSNTASSQTEQFNVSSLEESTEQRFSRAMNVVFGYDFKVGNYLPETSKKLSPHLFNTIKDVTAGIRKSA